MLDFADASQMDIDSTVQEANAAYPSDAGLMVKLAQMITKVSSKMAETVSEYIPVAGLLEKMRAIKSKAKSYFFASKHTAKEIKQRIFRELHQKVADDYTKFSETLDVMSQRVLDLPWNIRRSYQMIQDSGRTRGTTKRPTLPIWKIRERTRD